jgi:hypothetical protein
LIVAASLATGIVAVLALVATPFIPAKVNILTGVVLLGFAFGWAMLAVLSVRFSDHPAIGSPTPPSVGRPLSAPRASAGPLGRDDRRHRTRR